MTTQHTQGRLTLELVESDSGTIRHLCPVDKDGLSVLTVVEHEGVKFAAVYLDDDARRLVAAWNACKDFDIDDLEACPEGGLVHLAAFANDLVIQRDELLEALKLAERHCPVGSDAEIIARAAIAKVEGGAA